MVKITRCPECNHSLEQHLNENSVCIIEHYGSVCLCDYYKVTLNLMLQIDVTPLAKTLDNLPSVINNAAKVFNQIPDLEDINNANE